jgi:hypothetical protein
MLILLALAIVGAFQCAKWAALAEVWIRVQLAKKRAPPVQAPEPAKVVVQAEVAGWVLACWNGCSVEVNRDDKLTLAHAVLMPSFGWHKRPRC